MKSKYESEERENNSSDFVNNAVNVPPNWRESDSPTKQIAEPLGVAGSTVAAMLAEGTVSGGSTVAAKEKQS